MGWYFLYGLGADMRVNFSSLAADLT